MVAQLAQHLEEVSCVLIPTGTDELLLPNICIAEILPWRRSKPINGVPEWCVGALGWRGQTLCLADYGVMISRPAVTQPRAIVVMNRIGRGRGAAFYALVTSALPRIVQVSEPDISYKPDTAPDAVALCVELGTQSALIPDLEYIESQITALGL